MSIEGAANPTVQAAVNLLYLLGVDLDEPGMGRTPLRMVQALAELTEGLRVPFDVVGCLARQFEPSSGEPHLILCCDVPFTSLCEHHILPFTGRATVGYLPAPGAKVAGISKLARLVQGLAQRPTMQERLGQQVTDALHDNLDVQGAGCLIDASHTCMTLRGPKATPAHMVTSHLTGVFRDPTVRSEFLALARWS